MSNTRGIPKSKPQHLLTWKRWYWRKRKLRLERGELCHGGRRTNNTSLKPGYDRLAVVIDEIAGLLSDSYQHLPFGLKIRSNIIGRKIATIKRRAPKMQVRVS